jgi:carbamate kinase
VETLLAQGHVVVAAAGGGLPVVWRHGKLVGVEALLDKDLTTALLGQVIGAEVLVIATEVADAVIGFGTPHERHLDWEVPAELRDYAEQGHFASGSMGPKVEAAIRFVEGGGRRAVITSLDLIAAAAQGQVGTVVECQHAVPAN